jgi:hypothetical protein
MEYLIVNKTSETGDLPTADGWAALGEIKVS